MHIPGKPSIENRIKQPSRHKFTDSYRCAFANALQREAANKDPLVRIQADMQIAQIMQGVGRTTTKTSSNQRKTRAASRAAQARGDRFAHSRN